ncbi:MAG: c-type cytochrome [Burkholderiales bacterium]|nr:c-type cytochrome [Burkholderiales bacterium]MDE2456742.1 c-type cytochrome [Burkholderiales bacterium]
MKAFIRATLAAALLLGGLACGFAAAAPLQGNPVAGGKKTAMCLGCHGIYDYKTGFPVVLRVPKIFGQNARYIANALAEYKRGERKHPSMRAIAETLSDQDMADLGAYFESKGTVTAVRGSGSGDAAEALALIGRGGCPACHGANFNKPVDPGYPKLAGQYSDYLYYALEAYKSNDKPFIGRGNPIMSAMAKQFTDGQLQAITQYIEGLPGDVITVQNSRFR